MKTYKIRKQLDWIDTFEIQANNEEEALDKFNEYLEEMQGCFEDTENIKYIDNESGIEEIDGEKIYIES